MPDILELLRAINPLDIHVYFDRVRIWLRQPLSRRDRKLLEEHCGRLYFLETGFGSKIEIYQPTETALQCLAHLPDDATVNYLEPTYDLIMPDAAQTERVHEAFKHGFLQPWHRSKGVRSYRSGFSTRRPPKQGTRRAGFWFQWYIDRPCKLTGEEHCFHFEGKHEGRQFVERLGIHHPRDLVNFDFDGYFRKYLRLYRVDLDRLGRHDHNKHRSAKRKRTNINDRKRGMALYRRLSAHEDQEDRSLQRFVDQYGRRGQYLTPFNLYDHWHKLTTSYLMPPAERNPQSVSQKSMAKVVVD